MPDDLDETDALAKTLEVLSVMVPAGYRARLAEVRLDPAAWHRYGQGQDAVTKPVRRYRWVIEPDDGAGTGTAAVDGHRLMEAALKQARGRRLAAPAGSESRSLVVLLADWQAGQGDGAGVAGLAERLAVIPRAIRQELQRLRRAGTPAGHVVLAGLGDLVEGCPGSDWYSNGAFTGQLTVREQGTLVRRALLAIVADAADTGLPVTVACVAGNHGETRRGGKIQTNHADSADVSAFEQVADACALDPDRFGLVRWCFPEGERLTLTVEVQGEVLGLTHGHLARTGGQGAAAKVTTWLKGQALAREPIADATILATGHYHHLCLQDLGGADGPGRGRLWVQAPALCDRSEWFSQAYGMTSRAGMATFTITRGTGFGDLQVHDLDRLEG